jgi:hypothetical protein
MASPRAHTSKSLRPGIRHSGNVKLLIMMYRVRYLAMTRLIEGILRTRIMTGVKYRRECRNFHPMMMVAMRAKLLLWESALKP